MPSKSHGASMMAVLLAGMVALAARIKRVLALGVVVQPAGLFNPHYMRFGCHMDMSFVDTLQLNSVIKSFVGPRSKAWW